ncbi:hypothetical protein C8R43DRAFT_957028 [Mycena crocata]|nr:hypothetical protein C8R43DRAFT_957028 [Mycena crocata]
MAKTTGYSNKPKSPRTPRKKPLSKSMIDDEADDSDDGILVDRGESPEFEGSNRGDGELSDQEYEQDFINDGDPFDGVSVHTDDATPPASIMEDHGSAKSSRFQPSAGRKKSISSNVIDILSSDSDEDMAALDPDDSMFKKPSGLKASTKRIASEQSEPAAASPSPKKPKLSKVAAKASASEQPVLAEPSSSPKPQRLSQKLATLSSHPEFESMGLDPKMIAYLELAMKKFEAVHGDEIDAYNIEHPATPPPARKAKLEPPPSPSPAKHRRAESPSTPSPAKKKGKRVDFDQVELEMGIQASQSTAGKKSRFKPAATLHKVESDEDQPGFNQAEIDRAVRESRKDAYSKPLSVRESGSGSTKAIGRLYQFSPDWLPPYDGLSPSPPVVASSSGSRGRKAKIEFEAESDTKPVANDLISRMQAGEDVGEVFDHGEVTPSALHHLDPETPMSMRQYFDTYGTDPPPPPASVEEPKDEFDDEDEDPTAFLETLETYKTHYNSRAPCGVNDPDIQDPVLRNSYINQPPLPAERALVPVFDPTRLNGEEPAPIKGGRVKFITWLNHLPGMNANNAFNAVLFVEALGKYVNPSRSSPGKASVQLSSGVSASQRLNFNDRVAPRKIGTNSDRLRKWISGVFHNQEWERFEAYMCLVFGEALMHAQLSPEKALSFQTMIGPANDSSFKSAAQTFASKAPADMFAPLPATTSPAKPRPSNKKNWTGSSKNLLAHDDIVPVYDARRTVINWDTDLGRLDDVLPRFNGEVPFASFIVVGYTVSAYQSTLSGGTEKVSHLGCNLLWVIVIGTPALKSKKGKEKAI